METTESRQSLEQLLVDESPQAQLVLTTEGEVRLWSRLCERMFGYTEAEALGHPLADLVMPPNQIEQDRASRQQALDGDTQLRAVMRRHKDGRLLYVDVSTHAVFHADGSLRCFVVTKHDVTAQRVERDTRWIGQRYGALLESVPDATLIVNDGGHIVLFNSQAERLFARGRDDMIGAGVEMLLPDRYRHAHLGHRARYLATPQLRNMGAGLELYGLRGDGTEFPVEISLSPLDTEEGQFVMSAIRDTTERNRFERELQEKNAALQQANQAKDRFLATMSHELRTPLNGIIGFTNILLMRMGGDLTPEQERQMGIVKSSAEHLLSLINDLLDVARIQAGTLELHPESVNVSDMLREEVHASLMPLAQKKGLSFELALPVAAPVLQVDRRALRQILINLANNAIKFTEHGAVSLTLLHGPDGLQVQVRDTGVGISEADQAKLFGAFIQLGDPRSRQEGTGMGLHLSAKLAQVMGARIEVHSQLGEGSCFTLRFAPT